MVKNNDIKTTQNWGRWCECHNGAPPIADLTGYICSKCKKVVCVNCIYKTEKGVLCVNCVKKLKPKNIYSLSAGTNKDLSTMLKPLAVLVSLSVLSLYVLFFFNVPTTNYLYITPFVFLLIAFLVLLVFGFKKLFRVEQKDVDLSEKELVKLDKKIKK